VGIEVVAGSKAGEHEALLESTSGKPVVVTNAPACRHQRNVMLRQNSTSSPSTAMSSCLIPIASQAFLTFGSRLHTSSAQRSSYDIREHSRNIAPAPRTHLGLQRWLDIHF
jgi:hypothetical protein